MNLSEILSDEITYEGKFWTHSKMLADGCTKISEGCQNCWSESMARRFGGMVDESGEFDGHIRLYEERMFDILPKSNRRAPRVWTYWNDMFHRNVPDWFRDKLFEEFISKSSDFHIICTKRPGIAASYLLQPHRQAAPLKNVIILVTMENQERVNERIEATACISSGGWKVGALCEPLLSAVDFTGEWGACLCGNGPLRKRWIDALSWVITGAETGRGSRKAKEEWFRLLRDQAVSANVPFFLKYTNNTPPRVLDGRTWGETP